MVNPYKILIKIIAHSLSYIYIGSLLRDTSAYDFTITLKLTNANSENVENSVDR